MPSRRVAKLDQTSERALSFALVAQDVLLSGALQFLSNIGLPRMALVRRLRALAAMLERDRSIRAVHSDEYQIFASVSGVVHDWTRSAEYTGTNGEPRPLPLKGRRGLLALIKRRVPRKQTSQALHWMTARGIVRRRSNGHYVLFRRAVLVGNPDPVYLEWAAAVAVQHLKTAFENWAQRSPEARHLDRVARVFNLPKKDVLRFQQFAKSRAESWLEEIDNWLEDRNALSRQRRKVEAGVHVYGYVKTAPH
jgi:hypothetical protein